MKMHRIGVTALALLVAGPVLADQAADAKLVINGDETLTVRAPAPAYLDGALSEVRSGWTYRDPSTQEMETDDFSNPGMIAVDTGHALWDTVDGTAGKSCSSCHNDISSMKGVRASMPKINTQDGPGKGELWSMEDYINNCRTTRMGAKAWGWNSKPMQSTVAAISVESAWHAGERRHRRPGEAALGTRQGDVLHAHRPA